MSAYFFGWDYKINKQEKTAWQLVNGKADFFTKRIDSNRELECSTVKQTLQGHFTNHYISKY